MSFNKFAVICILLVGLLSSYTVTASTPIIRCDDRLPMPLQVQIDDCVELPCDMWKDQDLNMKIQFLATKNSMMHIKADVRANFYGIENEVKLEEERSNVCKNLMYGAYCPIDTNEDVTYNLVMRAPEGQPEVRTKMVVSLLDQTDNSVVSCFVTYTRVQKSAANNWNILKYLRV